MAVSRTPSVLKETLAGFAPAQPDDGPQQDRSHAEEIAIPGRRPYGRARSISWEFRNYCTISRNARVRGGEVFVPASVLPDPDAPVRPLNFAAIRAQCSLERIFLPNPSRDHRPCARNIAFEPVLAVGELQLLSILYDAVVAAYSLGGTVLVADVCTSSA